MAQQLPPQQGGGPQWANPNVSQQQQPPQQQQQQQQQQYIPAATIQQNAQDEFFAPLSTLDEPVMETIMRDVRSVGSKLKVVLLPMERSVRQFNFHFNLRR